MALPGLNTESNKPRFGMPQPPASPQRGNFGPIVPPGASRGTLGSGGSGGLGTGGGGGGLYSRSPSFSGLPTLGNVGARGGGMDKPPPPPAPPARGSESGPGILESWFNQRASGTDPAYEYAMTRGMNDIDRRMAAGGSFNSGARGLQLSDFGANMGAQRMGQLDALAGGASGEHMRRLEDMFQQGLGVAGGQAGVGGAYDLKGADSLNAANQAILSMFLNKAGVDSKSNQQGLSNLMGLGSLFFG